MEKQLSFKTLLLEKREEKEKPLYKCRIWIKNQEAGIVIVGENHVKELYKIICIWLKNDSKTRNKIVIICQW